MPKLTFRERKEVGEQFVRFLRDTGREAVSSKKALRAIYNQEFRTRNETQAPNFSSVLYTLRQSGRAMVTGDLVCFGKVKKKVKIINQYWEPKPEEPPVHSQEPGTDQPPRRGRAQSRAEFISRKHGVEVLSDHDLGNGRIRFRVTVGEPKTATIRVKNNGQELVTLLGYRVLRKQPELTFHDESRVTRDRPLALPSGDSYSIKVQCQTQQYGYFLVTVVFEFTKEQDGPFTIGRFVAAVANSTLAEELGPSAPYRPYEAKLRKPVTVTMEEGVPPDNDLRCELEKEIPLGSYSYPPHLKDTVQSSAKRSKLQSSLASQLQFENYREKFQLLLHLEELQMEVDIRRYDMQNARMVKDAHKKLLVLEVPGLAENRPSVLKGDHLLASLSAEQGSPQIIQYKGYAHAVELETVKLGFSKKLLDKFVDNLEFDVTFTFSRLPLKLQHRAVELAEKRNLRDVLFPSFSYKEALLAEGSQFRLFDRSLEKNQEQHRAVWQILTGMSRPAPYIIFGPPGTGKTVTMVEAIKQVITCFKSSRVLACAPSNSASDLLCQHLMKHLDRSSIYRINSRNRDYRQVPEEIKPCCNWDCVRQSHVYPSKETLQRYRVIVTTLVTAGRLVTASFPAGHFSHVFIDECGHAPEPESMIAIAGILSVMDRQSNTVGGQLVLAGDPRQLGPILRSPLAVEHGLGVSLLERIMNSSLYQKGEKGYDPQFVTKLLRNYRSHAAILKVPNEQFYEGELQECADPLISSSYCTWETLPTQGFPIIFHGVLGEDQREGTSPSFFNTAEVEVLVSYLKKLLQSQGKRGHAKISPKEIGVISPYRKQVEKIRQAITKKDKELLNLPDIKELKVGSVEEFQGQERRVLLISTVRSCSEYLPTDKAFKLGFINNPKRFNVAITRAKALLIIVGNPAVLSQDPHWATFLKYCIANGAYTGYPYAAAQAEEEALAKELDALHLSTAGSQLEASHAQHCTEQPWRQAH